MPRIVISYRREDAASAGRLYDHLVEVFGGEHVFMDVDAIPVGADFVEEIDRAVAKADVLLAVIGKNWLAASDSQGRQRLDRQRPRSSAQRCI